MSSDTDTVTEAEEMLYSEIAEDPSTYITAQMVKKMAGKPIDEDAMMMACMLLMSGILLAKGVPMETIEYMMIERDYEWGITFNTDGELNVKQVFLDENGDPFPEGDDNEEDDDEF